MFTPHQTKLNVIKSNQFRLPLCRQMFNHTPKTKHPKKIEYTISRTCFFASKRKKPKTNTLKCTKKKENILIIDINITLSMPHKTAFSASRFTFNSE